MGPLARNQDRAPTGGFHCLSKRDPLADESAAPLALVFKQCTACWCAMCVARPQSERDGCSSIWGNQTRTKQFIGRQLLGGRTAYTHGRKLQKPVRGVTKTGNSSTPNKQVIPRNGCGLEVFQGRLLHIHAAARVRCQLRTSAARRTRSARGERANVIRIGNDRARPAEARQRPRRHPRQRCRRAASWAPRLARTGHPPGELQLDRWAVDPGTGAPPGDQDAMFEEAGFAHPFSSKQNTSFFPAPSVRQRACPHAGAMRGSRRVSRAVLTP